MSVSSPGPPSITLALLVADQGVVEGRAFEALEAEEPVVAVAAGLVLGQRDPDAAARAPAPTSVAKEAMSPLPAPPSMRS